MRKAVYPGSFDPISNGHLDIIRRAAKMFDELHVLVSININKKKSFFTIEERISMIEKVTKDLPNVFVTTSSDLVVRYAMDHNINTIVRGLRNYSDYEAEFSLYQFNRDIAPEIETIILLPRSKNICVSSTTIRELVYYGIDISHYVPHEIIAEITHKLRKE